MDEQDAAGDINIQSCLHHFKKLNKVIEKHLKLQEKIYIDKNKGVSEIPKIQATETADML